MILIILEQPGNQSKHVCKSVCLYIVVWQNDRQVLRDTMSGGQDIEYIFIYYIQMKWINAAQHHSKTHKKR